MFPLIFNNAGRKNKRVRAESQFYWAEVIKS